MKKELVTEGELSDAGLTRSDWNWMINHKGSVVPCLTFSCSCILRKSSRAGHVLLFPRHQKRVVQLK